MKLIRCLFLALVAFGLAGVSPVRGDPEAEKPGGQDQPAVDPDTLSAVMANAEREYDKAMKHAQAALQRNPKDGVALAARATVHARRDKDYKAALRDVEAAIENGYKDAEAFWLKAECQRETGDKTGATKTLREAIELAPDEPGRHMNLGEHLRAIGEYAEAIKAYEGALKLRPAGFSALEGIVLSYMDLGDYKRGLEYSKRLVETGSWSGAAWYNHGRCLWETGAKAEAEQAYLKATEKSPGMCIAWINVAFVRMDTDRYAEALAPATRAVEIDPAHPIALTNLAAIECELGRFDEALRNASFALTVEPTGKRYWLRAAIYEKLERLPERVADLDRAVALDPAKVDWLVDYGDALSDLHRYDLALKQFDAALARDATRWDAAAHKADALGSMHKGEGALKFLDGLDKELAAHPRLLVARLERLIGLQRAREAHEYLLKIEDQLPMPEMGQFLRAAALGLMGKLEDALAALPESKNPRIVESVMEVRVKILFETGRLDEARKICEEALPRTQRGYELREILADIHRERGEKVEALAICRELAAKRPFNVSAQLDLARAHAINDDLENALVSFSAAIRANPWSADALSARGYFFMQRGENAGAAADFDRALGLNPRHLGALINRAILHVRQRERKQAEAYLARMEAEITRRLEGGVDPVEMLVRQAEAAAVRSQATEDPDRAAKLRKAALGFLKKHVEAGRLVPRAWRDTLDFDALREEPDFKALFEPKPK